MDEHNTSSAVIFYLGLSYLIPLDLFYYHPTIQTFREQMLMTGMDNDVNQALVNMLDDNNTAGKWDEMVRQLWKLN